VFKLVQQMKDGN
jgi:hypothetical protein